MKVFGSVFLLAVFLFFSASCGNENKDEPTDHDIFEADSDVEVSDIVNDSEEVNETDDSAVSDKDEEVEDKDDESSDIDPSDKCPDDPDKTEPGICGCGVSDVDTDGDGTVDCNDDCPNEKRKVAEGVCGCDLPENDYDKDGTMDCIMQGGKSKDSVTEFKIAVIIVDFSDTDPTIRAMYPTKSDLETLFFDSSSLINEYLKDMSYGKFTGLTGDVFGPFTHPRTIGDLVSSGDYAKEDYPQTYLLDTGSAIQIPGFDIADYDSVQFISYDDYSWNPGGLTGLWTFKINDTDVENYTSTVQALHIGYENRDTNYDLYNEYTQKQDGSVFVPKDVDENGEVSVPHPDHNMTRFERTFLHELIHAMGIFTHADSAIADGVALYSPNDENDFHHEEYGDFFSMMGNAEFATSVCTAYRDMLGWYDDTTQKTITTPGVHAAVVYPVGNAKGVHSVEIRLPYKIDEFFSMPEENRLNDGYFLEVRASQNKWDSGLKSPQLEENTKGVMVTFNDGYTSWLLDASPSPYLNYDWGEVADKRDVVLKPGMSLNAPDVTITCTAKNADGGYELEINVADNWGDQ